MSLHAYSRVWLHLVWATLERRPLLDEAAAARLSAYLHEYAKEKSTITRDVLRKS
jgi:REP element-mobilizing transposase RayT